MADDDATVQVSEPGPTDPMKEEIYRYRGETVSIGAAMDWVIRGLAVHFADSTNTATKRCWKHIKHRLGEEDLSGSVQPQMRAVAAFFEVRRLAVHAGLVLLRTSDSTQILRLYYDETTQRVDDVAVDVLKREAVTARQGYEAARAIGRELDDALPTVLAGLGTLPKVKLIGRP
jgi:hypothetical protein